MKSQEELDSQEADLYRDTLTSLNAILPELLGNADEKTSRALEVMELNRKTYLTAYANNMLWTMRAALDRYPVNHWVVRTPKNRLHLVDQISGLTVSVTKAFAFGGGLAPAGHNKARQKAYMQGFLGLESLDDSELILTRRPLEGKRLFITWNEVTRGEFDITGYVPADLGHFPKPSRARITIPMGLPEPEFASLSFSAQQAPPILVPNRNVITERIINDERVEGGKHI